MKLVNNFSSVIVYLASSISRCEIVFSTPQCSWDRVMPAKRNKSLFVAVISKVSNLREAKGSQNKENYAYKYDFRNALHGRSRERTEQTHDENLPFIRKRGSTFNRESWEEISVL